MSSSGESTLVIGLLQVMAQPWKSIYENGQLPTWIENSPKSIEVVNIYGKKPNKLVRRIDISYEKMRWSPLLQGPIHILNRYLTKFLIRLDSPKVKIESNKEVTNLFVEVPSMHLTLPLVEVAFFRYFLRDTNAQFLYMSNTSSYVNLKKLILLVEQLPKVGIYGGTLMNFAGIKFASGSNRLFSRDVIQFIVNEFKNWDFQYIEDVSLGKLLSGHIVNEIEIPSISFSSREGVNETDLESLKSAIHFRLKSGALNARNDVELMLHLHSVIVSQK